MSTLPFGSEAQGAVARQIEFPCGGCGRLLKVAENAAGRQAKCPQCGAVQQVPATGGQGPNHRGDAFAAAPTAPPGAAPAPTGYSPFGPAPQAPPAYAPAPVMATPVAPAPAGATAADAARSIFDRAQPAGQAAAGPAPLSKAAAAQGKRTPTRDLFERITAEISKVYVGQDELVLGALVALFSSGHVLIESVPGLGKTLFVRTLGRVLGCQFNRIQFTADLMPSDITGAPLFDMKTQEFRFRPGPVFTQFLLADEINRSPAKTHAALLEIMQEYRVTVDGVSHNLKRPFLVLATQNPIESEGTYNLPEAQLDRFMFKLIADYPQEQEEAAILKMHSTQEDINQKLEHDLATVTSPDEIVACTKANSEVRIDDRLVDYINKIVRATRRWPQFHIGASPRAGLALMQASRTLAAFMGRDYAVPDDVVQLALPALRHRVNLTAEAEVEGHNVDELLADLIRTVEVPRI
jgi:MoxR-like ATPase